MNIKTYEYQPFIMGGGKIQLPKVELPKVALPSTHFVDQKEESYIRDGLVFWLDGKNKGGVEGKWTDLIGGVEFTPDTTTHVEMGPDFVRGRLKSSVSLDYPYDSYTIECAFRTPDVDTRTNLWFQCGVNNSIAAGIANVTVILSRQAKVTYIERTARNVGAHCVSGNAKMLLHNFAANHNHRMDDYWATTVVGASVGNTNYNPEYCSIRIYDRLLTEEEMLHNQKVDKKRFNLIFPDPVMTLELDEFDYEELSGMGQV